MEDKRIQSIFGDYAKRLQLIIDRKLDKFAPTWFQKYFTFGTPQLELTYMTAVGRTRIEAAASVVDREADAPLRGRPNLDKYSGEVAAIKQAFKLKEADVRTWLALQSMPVIGDSQKIQVLDLIWGDVQKSGNAAMKKLDMMVLEAVSTGKITINTTNNPDGVVYDDIDLLVPADHKTTVDVLWSDKTDATPIENIKTVVQNMSAKGISYEKILISPTVLWAMQKCDEVISYIFGLTLTTDTRRIIPTLDNINEFMTANRLPYFEIVDEVVGVEKNGLITSIKPFAQDVCSFIPAGGLGVIHNAYSIEQLRPVDGVSYGTFNRALISKWSQARPFAEYTQVELNAFPGLEVADQIHIMTVL